LSEVRTLIKSHYDKAASVALEGTSAIAEVAARATALSLGTAAVLPSATMLEAIASQSVIQGAAQGAWWARQSADTAFRFGQAVRQGMVNAETNQQIIRRVRSFLDTSQANAAALVQTSTATVANDARQLVFDRNEDIIKRYRAVATLDTKTCERCAPLDGLEWDKEGNGIGHSTSKPTYPLHFNCRCLLIGRISDEAPGGMRAATGGPVSAKLTFEGWLERQSKEKQEDMLGKGRAELYRAGKITLADLTRGNGRPLTLDELRTKYA
jgi:SPP1 gp7 family putative phage head morphogenesis protein